MLTISNSTNGTGDFLFPFNYDFSYNWYEKSFQPFFYYSL